MGRQGIYTSLLLAFALAACSPAGRGAYSGYAEGEYLYLAAREPGTLETLSVKEGDEVGAGATLFILDDARHAQAVARARATHEAALARVADLSAGARPEEVRQLEAAAGLAANNAQRSRDLFARGQVSKAQLDRDAAALTQARAALANARGGRANAIAAAERDSEAAAAALAAAELDLADRTVKAPQAGRIERVFHRPGEVLGAGAPVLSLLPPAEMKVRFFVAERDLARVKLGQPVSIACDGCAAPLKGAISFVASEPQFTPPVIYSLNERQKLVYLVEARPANARALRPGQPVDVSLAP
jgi:HlyD family secretion protein